MLIKNSISKFKDIEILGPVNSPIFKIREKFRTRLLIRSSKKNFVQNYLSDALKNIILPDKIKLAVDVDPINFN